VIQTGSETHGVCYCRDCQAYARALGQEREVLDAMGGTEVVGVAPRNVVFTEGRESLACLSLTEEGLLRWYAGCCDTPIGNTPRDFKMSFVGVIHTCLRHSTRSIEDSFGPVRMRANIKDAKGKPDPMRMSTAVRLVPFAVSLLRARWSGAYRSTPFFSEGGTAVVTPRVLSKIELERAMKAN
jgi:hypothetical protein